MESRPSLEDYKEKVDLIECLNDKLTLSATENLAFKLELTNNKMKIESLQGELKECKEAVVPAVPSIPAKADAVIQTEQQLEEKAIIKKQETSPINESSVVLKESSKEKVPSEGSGVEEVPALDTTTVDSELEIIHHPDVEREEELVLFKEKYTKLVEEKLLIDKELASLREDYQQYRNKSLTHLLMYLAPFFALIAYLFIHYSK